MRKILLFFGIVFFSQTHAQTMTAMTTSNGIAQIPTFRLGNPAEMVFFSTNITKFLEFSPDFMFNLKNGKPWLVDTWLRGNMKLDSAGRWIGSIGMNWSLYFQKYPGTTEDVTQTIRYPNPEFRLKFIQNKVNTFTADYQYMWAVEKKYGVYGSYYSLLYSRTQELKKFILNGNMNAFYLHLSDGTRGISTAFDANIMHAKSGLFLGFQIVEPVTLNNAMFDKAFFLGITRKLH